jgi:predicted MFS family arabinose efflux permease
MSLNSCLQQLSSGVASLLGGMLVTQSADGRLVGFGRLAWISALAIVGSLLLVRRLNRYPDEKALAAVGAGLAEVD